MSLTLQVQQRGREIPDLPSQLPISTTRTSDIYEILSQHTKLSIQRLRITKGSDGTLLPLNASLMSTGLRNNSVICVKDLGPQISWTSVFVIEYLGPLIIHPIVYFGRRAIYNLHVSPEHNHGGGGAAVVGNGSLGAGERGLSQAQMWTFYMIMFHFIKRQVETLFIHRFSLSTMPVRNVYKNSAHYWLLAGLNIAYWVYSPSAPAASSSSRFQGSSLVWLGLLFFLVGETGNLYTHVVLRNLRAPGSTARAIPRGFGFQLVTCPNYMFEALAWLGLCLVSWSYATLLFTLVAVGQMAVWARGKEKRYRREFGDKYKAKSSAMIPGLI